MKPQSLGRRNLAVLLVMVCVQAAGCDGSSRAYAPGESEARQALERSLSTWRQGRNGEALAREKPPIHAVDFQWQNGETLEDFQVVTHEPATGDLTHRFTVGLKLAKSKAETSTRYIVIGRDPIWVYREEDYARLLNMDNNPRPTKQRGRK